MAHLITPDLIKKSSKGRKQRRVQVVDEIITVKVGKSVTRAQYDLLEAVYAAGVPCPKPLFFVEFEDEINGIVMSTVEGHLVGHATSRTEKGDTDDEVKAVAMDIKRAMDQLQPAMLARYPHDNTSIYSVSDNKCLCFPFLSFDRDAPVPLTDFVDTMMEVAPQGEEGLITRQRSMLSDLIMSGDQFFGLKFCHMDLHPGNIMVKDGHLSGILDWDFGGWYTPAMEMYVMAEKVCTLVTVPGVGGTWFAHPMCEAWGIEDGGKQLVQTIAFEAAELMEGSNEEEMRLSHLQDGWCKKKEKTEKGQVVEHITLLINGGSANLRLDL